MLAPRLQIVLSGLGTRAQAVLVGLSLAGLAACSETSYPRVPYDLTHELGVKVFGVSGGAVVSVSDADGLLDGIRFQRRVGATEVLFHLPSGLYDITITSPAGYQRAPRTQQVFLSGERRADRGYLRAPRVSAGVSAVVSVARRAAGERSVRRA